MGGNAFDKTVRLSEEAYYELCRKISQVLNELNVQHRFPPEITDKAQLSRELKNESDPYGDVDVIVGLGEENVSGVVSMRVAAALGSVEPVKRGNKTHNILTRERHQVDLLFCEKDELDFLTALKSNNDFLAFLGHLLSRFRLKLTEKGLVMLILSKDRKMDFVLSRDLCEIRAFLGLPDHSLDGRTRLSTSDAFDILVKSNVYFHSGDEFDHKYRLREGKKGRAMIQKMFQYLDEYDGRWEEDKIGSSVRENLREYLENRESRRPDFEDIIGSHFGLMEEVRMARVSMTEAKEKKPDIFGKMIGWFPDRLDNKKGITVIINLRKKYGSGKSELFNQWSEGKTELELREAIQEVMSELRF